MGGHIAPYVLHPLQRGHGGGVLLGLTSVCSRSARAGPPCTKTVGLMTSRELGWNEHGGDVLLPAVAGPVAGPEQIGSGDAPELRIGPILEHGVANDPRGFGQGIESERAAGWGLKHRAKVHKSNPHGFVAQDFVVRNAIVITGDV